MTSLASMNTSDFGQMTTDINTSTENQTSAQDWNNLQQTRPVKLLQSQINRKPWRAMKSKVLNSLAKSDQCHICLGEDHLSFNIIYEVLIIIPIQCL